MGSTGDRKRAKGTGERSVKGIELEYLTVAFESVLNGNDGNSGRDGKNMIPRAV